MATIFKLRRDTAANWSSENPTLADGELGFDKTNTYLKIGDGSTAWNSLGQFTQSEESITDFIGGTVTGNTETFITVTYDDSDNTLDFVVPVLDEDNLASNSATHLATQQSIKAYVDAQVTAQDLDFTADSGGPASIDLDSETLGIGGSTGIDTTISGNNVQIAIDGTVATLAGTQTFTNKTLTTPTITSAVLNTGVSGSAVLDEDDMSTNSATQLATQQSIKAYVDAQVTAQDLDFQGDSGGALNIDLDSETLDIAGGTGIDTVGSGNTLTVAIDSTVATLADSQTLTNKSLTSPALTGTISGDAFLDEADGEYLDTAVDASVGLGQVIKEWWKNIFDTAWRDYTGSVCLYMPKDIQINDSMVYNEDTRQIGALAESLFTTGDAKWADVVNPTVLFSPTVTTAITGGIGKLALGKNTSAAIAAFAGYGIGDILTTEIQRTSGKVGNPNELLRYASTALRTFTFNWIFLPDSEDESKQITGLIKMFRKSAHATLQSSTIVTVPDHVVTSFHGAEDIIQIPPCYIESVNVNYNPNNSSFFKQGNRPVEISLAVNLKEIIPIYQEDVEDGY